MGEKHVSGSDGGHDFLVQGIDNGGIHACIHHQGNKGSVDDFSLGQAIGDVGQAAGDVDLGKSCLFSGA